MYYIYSKENCKWCKLAKELLDTEDHRYYYEYLYKRDFTKEQLQKELAKFNIITEKITLPQIFVGSFGEFEEYVGTYEDLIEYLKKERVI